MNLVIECPAIPGAGTGSFEFETASGLRIASGPPRRASTYERASDEDGRLGISGATNRLGLGDKVRLIPGDSTVNTYHWYVCIGGNRVGQLWPITAGGAVY